MLNTLLAVVKVATLSLRASVIRGAMIRRRPPAPLIISSSCLAFEKKALAVSTSSIGSAALLNV